MINDVVLEGIIVKTWKYADDLLFRLACYRDPDLPQKALNLTQDAADFVTIRVLKGNLGAPVVVEKNLHVRVHGFIQSRDYEESLADFLKDARGAALALPDKLDPNDLRAPPGRQHDADPALAQRVARLTRSELPFANHRNSLSSVFQGEQDN